MCDNKTESNSVMWEKYDWENTKGIEKRNKTENKR